MLFIIRFDCFCLINCNFSTDFNNLFQFLHSDEPFGRKRFGLLVRDLKKGFKSKNLLLSFTFLKARNVAVSQGFLTMSKHVDFLNVHQNFSAILIKSGVKKSKIVIIIEFMGRGNFGYYSACDLFTKTVGWEKYYDSKIGTAIATLKTDDGQTKKMTFPCCGRSVANTVRQAIRSKVAGVMAYTIDSDDSQGKCGFDDDTFNDFGKTKGVYLHVPMRNSSTFPLLRTISEAISMAKDEVKQEKQLQKSH